MESNGNTKHFMYNPETTLDKIGHKGTVIPAGDIDIEKMKN